MRISSRYLGVLVALAIAIFPKPVYADWCGATDAQNWQEFETLLGADVSSSSERPLLIIAGAPWCPYCAQAFKNLQAKRYRFDVRFVPQDAINPKDRDQLADLVVDGTVKSLVRVFVQRSVASQPVAPQQKQLVNDIQLVTMLAMIARFESPGGAKLASPTVFYLTRDRVRIIAGMPNFEAIEREIVKEPRTTAPPTMRRFLQTGLPTPRPIAGIPVAKKSDTRLRILPDGSAFSYLCSPKDGGYSDPNVNRGVVHVDGEDWLAFSIFPTYPNLFIYGRGSEFTGWQPL
ncbi:MAG: thioredoxin family protein [Hyphomicrobiaceae bacterium]